MAERKVVVVSAPPDVCPPCPIFKVHLKRLLRRKFRGAFKFEELDSGDPRARLLVAERGVWFYSPEDDDVQFPVPQAFVVIDGNAYLLFGNPVWIEELLDEVLEARLRKYAEGGEPERLHMEFLKEDVCDPTNASTAEFEGKEVGIIVGALRPDLCKDVLEKAGLSDDAKKLVAHIEGVLKTRFEEVKKKVLEGAKAQSSG